MADRGDHHGREWSERRQRNDRSTRNADADVPSSSSTLQRESIRRHEKRRHASDTERRRNKRRKRSNYDDDNSSASSSSSGSSYRRRKRKQKKKRKREGKKKSKTSLNSEKRAHNESSSGVHPKAGQPSVPVKEDDRSQPTGFDLSDNPVRDGNKSLDKSVKQQTTVPDKVRKAAMVPMTREQYEMQQSQIREVYDEETGRYRLMRGSGEIMERIVSRSDHEHINSQATRGDGSSFSRHIFSVAKRR